MQYLFVKTLGGLKPADAESEEWFGKVGDGANVLVEVKELDAASYHRKKLQNKFFAMVEIILDNQEHYTSKEQVLSALCIGVGHSEFFRGPGGAMYSHRKSVSYDETTDKEFIELYDNSIKFVTTEIIPGLEAKDLHEAVMQLTGF